MNTDKILMKVGADNDWWNTIPDSVMENIEAALLESNKGQVISHEEIKKQIAIRINSMKPLQSTLPDQEVRLDV